MAKLRLSSEPQAAQSDSILIEDAVNNFNMEKMQDWNYQPVRLFLRDETNAILGGIVGGVWGGWFHIHFLWVAEHLRGQGYGGQLLQAAEQEALGHDCHNAFLETHSFQAPEFYLRYGYEAIARLDDYPPGECQFIMRKRL